MSDPIHPVLDRGFVTLIDEPNSDLKVVNAARVSFAKKSTAFEERDAKLIQYLAKNNHWTPFAHCRTLTKIHLSVRWLGWMCNVGGFGLRSTGKVEMNDLGEITYEHLLSYSLAHFNATPFPSGYSQPFKATCPHSVTALTGLYIAGTSGIEASSWSEWPEEEPVTLHIKMPLFVAAQWKRSTVGIVYNEVSRRYVDDPPEFHVPSKWRKRPDKSIKQGSSDETLDHIPSRPACYEEVYDEYSYLLGEDVAPEQARIVLPVSTYTELWMTCSLKALARVLKLRLDPHAQWEVRQYAQAVRDLVAPKYPILETLL